MHVCAYTINSFLSYLATETGKVAVLVWTNSFTGRCTATNMLPCLPHWFCISLLGLYFHLLGPSAPSTSTCLSPIMLLRRLLMLPSALLLLLYFHYILAQVFKSPRQSISIFATMFSFKPLASSITVFLTLSNRALFIFLKNLNYFIFIYYNFYKKYVLI